VAAQPDNVNEPIPRKTMVAKDKLLAEGGLSETKVILGWLFNFQMLTVSLPDHKFIAWIAAIQKMITPKRTTLKDLPLPQSTLFPALPQQKLTICHSQRQVQERFGVNDRQAKNGIDMSLLTFRAPNRTYYSDLCPAGLGGYSDQGHTWRFHVPSHLQF